MRAHPVLHGDLLRADLFNPDARQLFVTFRQRLAQPGAFDTPQPVKSFVRAGYAHLHLQSRWNDWYINAETPALDAALREASAPYDRVVGMGFSMGGYAALRFSAALRLEQLIAVSPQFSLSPRVLPQDTRYRDCAAGYDDALGDLAAHGRADLAGALLFDPFKRMDLLNARRIQSAFPRVELCRLAGSGHPASRVLREAGRFAALQRQLLQGAVEAREIRALHRASRRDSPLYWTQLAEIAARHGRGALARRARAQAHKLGRGVQAGEGGK